MGFDPQVIRIVRGAGHRKYCCSDHHDLHEAMFDRMTGRQREFQRTQQLELQFDHVGAYNE